jgi:hypothetical protein
MHVNDIVGVKAYVYVRVFHRNTQESESSYVWMRKAIIKYTPLNNQNYITDNFLSRKYLFICQEI